MKTQSMPKNKIKNAVIVCRHLQQDVQLKSAELVHWLTENGIKSYSHPKRPIYIQSKKVPNARSLENIQLVIVLGGDGTYLEAVRFLKGKSIPILGVNMGSLGFLTETPVTQLFETIEKTLAGKMEMRPRTMLSLSVQKNDKIIYDGAALNDVVIERASRSHLIYLKIFCEKEFVSDVKADGVIIASPTGSTAYNLAAGGPILHPEVEATAVTPICPHSLTNRPLIFPSKYKLRFELHPGEQTASLNADGLSICELDEQCKVVIKQSKHTHFVLKTPDHNYFQLLTKKLQFGLRA
jgi:NAD+ kinase